MSLTDAPPRPADQEFAPAPERESHTSGRTLVLFGTLLAVALMLALPIRTWLAQKAELEEMHTGIAAAQARVADLQAKQQQWQDPRYIESQARLRLNMVKPGESGLIALDRTQTSRDEAPEVPATTWYDKVWRSTDAAAGRRPAQVPDAQPDAG